MNALDDRYDDEAEPEDEAVQAGPLSAAAFAASCADNTYHEILRLLIAEGTESAMDMYFEAKDPNIDPALKLKLIALASRVGDDVRKAIATHTACFSARGRTNV